MFPRIRRTLKGVPLLALLLAASRASAADFGDVDGFNLRWDNTLHYSAGVRLEPQDPALISPPNTDDGDRDFAPGLMSNRLELLSVLDLTKDDFGAQLSVDAWYDTVYHASTDNKSPATFNPISVPNTEFTRATRNLEGQYAELGDSFVYANFILDDVPISLRAGRQTLLWGESLFFADNGIAAGQAPVDYVKLYTSPEGYSRDVYLPVNQISLSVQPEPDLSFAAYYQLSWRGDRLPAVGSYFSTIDVLGAGSERAILPGGALLRHKADEKPSGDGQFGVSLHKTIDELDVGIYYLRFDSKAPFLRVENEPVEASGYAGEFKSVYPSGINLFGASFSTYVDGIDVAGEASVRQRMPLVSSAPIPLYEEAPLQPVGDGDYARGNTFHVLLSAVTTLSPAFSWDSADLSAELSANDLLGITSHAAAIAAGRDRFAASTRVLFQPHYFEVLPDLDTTLLLGLGYNFSGNSSVDYAENEDSGDLEAGVSFTYMSTWTAAITVTTYLGAPPQQPLADRDFVMVDLQHTF